MRSRLLAAVIATICAFWAVFPAPKAAADVKIADSVPADFNYHWVNDPLSQILALTYGNVLHRINGSWFNAPDVPQEARDYAAAGKSLFGPSTPIFVGSHATAACTLTIAGTDEYGNKVGISAGHCGNVGDYVFSADTWKTNAHGQVVYKNPTLDYVIIKFEKNTVVSNSYNGQTINSMGGVPLTGDMVCKQGIATGNTCGMTLAVEGLSNWSQVCAMWGDSGAPVTEGDRLVGLVSGSVQGALACQSPLQGIFFSPMKSVRMDQILVDMNTLPEGVPGRGFRLVQGTQG
ncbi:MAG: S1 family peptidase [Corynebacterium sp.]|nr:S1 family peptidase [Corynebacterium sp.]